MDERARSGCSPLSLGARAVSYSNSTRYSGSEVLFSAYHAVCFTSRRAAPAGRVSAAYAPARETRDGRALGRRADGPPRARAPLERLRPPRTRRRSLSRVNDARTRPPSTPDVFPRVRLRYERAPRVHRGARRPRAARQKKILPSPPPPPPPPRARAAVIRESQRVGQHHGLVAPERGAPRASGSRPTTRPGSPGGDLRGPPRGARPPRRAASRGCGGAEPGELAAVDDDAARTARSNASRRRRSTARAPRRERGRRTGRPPGCAASRGSRSSSIAPDQTSARARTSRDPRTRAPRVLAGARFRPRIERCLRSRAPPRARALLAFAARVHRGRARLERPRDRGGLERRGDAAAARRRRHSRREDGDDGADVDAAVCSAPPTTSSSASRHRSIAFSRRRVSVSAVSTRRAWRPAPPPRAWPRRRRPA